jgi:hypothetical protein
MSHFADLRGKVSTCLPALNRAVEAGSVSPQEAAEVVGGWLLPTIASLGDAAASLPQPLARELLQLVAFLVSSAERHFQAAGEPPGSGLSHLEGAESLLMQLSGAGAHQPKDSANTYWIWNTEEPILTFTGDPQEIFFHHAVVTTDRLLTDACNTLRPIRDGNPALCSAEGISALATATQYLRDLRDLYRAFNVVNTSTGMRPIEPEFFAVRMRSYLVSYPIGGQVWKGVNAGNLASAIAADYIIGTVTEDYEERVVDRRWPNIVVEDQVALTADMAKPSVFHGVLSVIELLPHELDKMDEGSLSKHLAQLSSEQLAVAAHYADLAEAHGKQAATHYGLIINFLERFAEGLSEEEQRRMPVRPNAGTGGMPHEETRLIMEMRRNHPVIGKLVRTAKSLPNRRQREVA